ncbi:YbjN domain-containing protein [Paraconexibacter sp. AEG42_29]
MAGMLAREGIDFSEGSSGDVLFVPLEEVTISVAVLVFSEGSSSMVIMRARLVLEAQITTDMQRLRVLAEVNRLNYSSPFVTYYVDDDDELMAQVNLLGDDLQRTEFMNALTSLRFSTPDDVNMAQLMAGTTYAEWDPE